MPIVIFPRLLLQLLSLVVLAAAAYLLWSWWNGYDVEDAAGVLHHVHGDSWRLWTGVGLLVWSFGVGRAIVLLFIPGVVDALLVLGRDRRTLHDRIAGTWVINVR